VRNAALSLFSAVCSRAVGSADNSWRAGRRAPLGGSQAVTAAAFFAMYPAALGLLAGELAAGAGSALQPTLVLVSMFSRDPALDSPAVVVLMPLLLGGWRRRADGRALGRRCRRG
jgi:hypothetical protein